MKELHVCPNGEHVTRTEKFVGMVLGDSHQDRATRRTFPDVKTIAEDAMVSEKQCYRLLASLERKGVIRREHPAGVGRGKTTFYFFPELDDPKPVSAVNQPVEAPQKGCQDDRLFFGESLSEACQKHDISSTPIDNKNKSNKDQNTPLPPEVGGSVASTQNLPLLNGAVDQVMRGCGFVRLKVRRVVYATLRSASERGEELPSVAVAMIAAWKEQVRCRGLGLLKWPIGPEKFFGDNTWQDQDMWPWDQEALERQRDARVGIR
jgi:hypothetical protein